MQSVADQTKTNQAKFKHWQYILSNFKKIASACSWIMTKSIECKARKNFYFVSVCFRWITINIGERTIKYNQSWQIWPGLYFANKLCKIKHIIVCSFVTLLQIQWTSSDGAKNVLNALLHAIFLLQLHIPNIWKELELSLMICFCL